MDVNPISILRTLVYQAILERKRAGSYVINDFEVEETWLPVLRLEAAGEHGKVWVVGLASDDELLTRGHSFSCEIPIQIALQKLLEDDPARSTETIDRYLLLERQLRDTCRLATREDGRFGWIRSNAMRDESGMPVNFAGLRNSNTVEAYFTAHYKTLMK